MPGYSSSTLDTEMHLPGCIAKTAYDDQYCIKLADMRKPIFLLSTSSSGDDLCISSFEHLALFSCAENLLCALTQFLEAMMCSVPPSMSVHLCSIYSMYIFNIQLLEYPIPLFC